MLNALFLKLKPKSLLILIFAICFCISCNNKKTKEVVKTSNSTTINDTISVYNYEKLKPLLYSESNKIHIVNFWAMWCAPCVKELPYIQEYSVKNPDADVLLISMDFPKDIETKLKPFLKTKNITNKVVILDDPDANTWINKIDPNWSGAIPFTIIFNNKKRAFYERSFESLEDLENEINKTFNK